MSGYEAFGRVFTAFVASVVWGICSAFWVCVWLGMLGDVLKIGPFKK